MWCWCQRQSRWRCFHTDSSSPLLINNLFLCRRPRSLCIPLTRICVWLHNCLGLSEASRSAVFHEQADFRFPGVFLFLHTKKLKSRSSHLYSQAILRHLTKKVLPPWAKKCHGQSHLELQRLRAADTLTPGVTWNKELPGSQPVRNVSWARCTIHLIIW